MPSLPATIDSRFLFLSSAQDDRALVESLMGNRSDLAHFVMQAAEDETWTSAHSEFYRFALGNLTHAFFIGRLDIALAHEIVNTLYRHHHVLYDQTPKPVKLINGDQVVNTNPLYLGVKSPEFLQKIRSGSSTKEVEITIGPYEPFAVEWVVHYCERGVAEGFFRLNAEELDELLKIAEDWQIDQVKEEIEKNRARFIEPDKGEEALVDAYRRGRLHLAKEVIKLLNSKRKGEKLYLDEENRIVFEFTHIDIATMDSFHKLKGSIGSVHGKYQTVMSDEFWEALHLAPLLSSLDLSESEGFSPLLWGIPETVKELDCSRCPWMNNAILTQIAGYLRGLEVIKLQNLSELTYAGFTSFHQFKSLKMLDLSHCHGLTEREAEMIRRLQPGVKIVGFS